MRSITAFFTAFIASALVITAHAETYDSISVSDTPSAGDNFTVTVSISSDSDIGYLQSTLEYDESVIEFVSGDAMGGGGIVNVKGFPTDDAKSVSCVLTFKALAEGDSTLTLSNGYVFSPDGVVLEETSSAAFLHVDGPSDGDGEEQSESNAELPVIPIESDESETDSKADNSGDSKNDTDSKAESEADDSYELSVSAGTDSSLTEEIDAQNETQTGNDIDTEAPTQSAETVPQGYLADLSCSEGLLTPAFSYDVFDYTVYVDNAVKSAALSFTAASIEDIVSCSGGDELEVGDNIRKVTVTSPDGSGTEYTVKIVRAAADENAADLRNKDQSDTSSQPHDRYKDILNPALAIVLVTLVVALFIVIFWIRSLGKGKKKKKKKRRK